MSLFNITTNGGHLLRSLRNNCKHLGEFSLISSFNSNKVGYLHECDWLESNTKEIKYNLLEYC